MSIDAVIKVGGSLSRGDGLQALCREIGRLAELYRLLIIPGGGSFADQVREADRRYFLGSTAAHRMALLAMDQYGYLLNQLIPGSFLTSDLSFEDLPPESGMAAILLPSALIFAMDPLPHSWDVTSDSIAAWVARQVQCARLILLKDVEGLLTAAETPQRIAELPVRRLNEHTGGVDRHLSQVLAASGLETWIISGLRPERLSELLRTSCTVGTRIR